MLNFFYKARNKKGFTLIELIVVIAILAILALVAIPKLGAFRESAKQANDKQAAAIIANAAAMYYAQNPGMDVPTADGTWKSKLETAKLIVAKDYEIQAKDSYSGIAISGPTADGRVTVTLSAKAGSGVDTYVISK